MFNYIRAELYRNFHRAYLWIYTGILASLSLLMVVVAKINNLPDFDLTSLLDITTLLLTFPVFLVAAIIDMVTAEEQKNQTLRNIVTFGLSRAKTILSKLIVSVILAFFVAFIVLTVFYGSGTILYGLGKGFPDEAVNDLLTILAAVPLWIGALSVGTFLALAINNNTIFSFVYAGLFLLTSHVVQLLTLLVSDKFKYIHKILITTQLKKLQAPNLTSQDTACAVLIGLAYTVVFAGISVLYFKKKEVK